MCKQSVGFGMMKTNHQMFYCLLFCNRDHRNLCELHGTGFCESGMGGCPDECHLLFLAAEAFDSRQL